MGNAALQMQIATGTTPSWASAEGYSLMLDEADSATALAPPVPAPSSTGTNFSWTKTLALAVTATGTTTISNRTVAYTGSLPTGVQLFWKAVAQASYQQASAATQPPSSGSNGATPAGYTLMSTTPAVYDSAGSSSGVTGPNGMLLVIVVGIDATYVGGATASPISLPSLLLNYSEA